MKYKKIMKSNDDIKIGGVLSGISYYYELDPMVARIIFTFLFLFTGLSSLLLISYFISWIIIDKHDSNFVINEEKDNEKKEDTIFEVKNKEESKTD